MSDKLVQSWDIATTIGDHSDYSVCLTFLVVRRDYYLVDVWRGRLEYPDLRRKVIALAEKHQATTIVIEDAGPGQNLLQDLRHDRPTSMTYPIPNVARSASMYAVCGVHDAKTTTTTAARIFLKGFPPWFVASYREPPT